MGLIMNVYRDSCIPITQFGGTSMSGEFTNFQRQEVWYCINAGEAGILAKTSLPWGNRNPLVWRMALKAGGLAATSTNVAGSGGAAGRMHYGMPLLATIICSGGISSAAASMGMALLATITGEGGITDAAGSLLAQISASISGSGTISSADARAFLNAIATLTGTGEISSAVASGLGELIASLTGEGAVTTDLTAIGELSANIRAYGSLTPEAIRDAVWQATAANYNVTGSIGEKLNDAGSASNPWTEVISGSYTASDILQIMVSILAGKTSIAATTGGAIVTFKDLSGADTKVVATMTGSERTDISIS